MIKTILKQVLIWTALPISIALYGYVAGELVWPGLGVLMILGPFIGVIAYSFVKPNP